jgi:hypothetical protein
MTSLAICLILNLVSLEQPPSPVAATVETTLTSALGQIRQQAFDGSEETAFSTAEAGEGDHFTLVFDAPVKLDSVKVLTGTRAGDLRLEAGVLEVSADGLTFSEPVKFAHGAANLDLAGRSVKAVRIRPLGPEKKPLVIREIVVKSDPQVATFRFPVEYRVDASEAPELKPWADQSARLCERWYSRVVEELGAERTRPPRRVRLQLKKKYPVPAAAGGGEIFASVDWFQEHPDDVGALIHETAHIIQRYRGPDNPGWLVEGVADYVRFFKFEPPDAIGGFDRKTAKYSDGYRTTARFLDYVVRKYDAKLVFKLNQAMHEGQYRDAIWKESTGKTLEELGAEWKASL